MGARKWTQVQILHAQVRIYSPGGRRRAADRKLLRGNSRYKGGSGETDLTGVSLRAGQGDQTVPREW